MTTDPGQKIRDLLELGHHMDEGDLDEIRSATYDIPDAAAELEYTANELANASKSVTPGSRYSEGYRDALGMAERVVRSRAEAIRAVAARESGEV